MYNKCILLAGILSLSLLLGACAGKQTGPPRLVDLGNGVCQDSVTGRMWQKERTRSMPSIEAARNYAASLELGGFADWRLPTIYELYDLYYLRDLHVASSCDLQLDGNYWSDDKDGEGMAGAWEISDQCDPSRSYAKANKGFVRAVRP